MTDDDDIDIYGDLSLEEDQKISRRQNAELLERCAGLEKRVSELSSELQNLQKLNNTLEVNFSSLLKTAKSEISRKDRSIADLRQELEDLKFNRARRNLRRYDQQPQAEATTTRNHETPRIEERVNQQMNRFPASGRERDVKPANFVKQESIVSQKVQELPHNGYHHARPRREFEKNKKDGSDSQSRSNSVIKNERGIDKKDSTSRQHRTHPVQTNCKEKVEVKAESFCQDEQGKNKENAVFQQHPVQTNCEEDKKVKKERLNCQRSVVKVKEELNSDSETENCLQPVDRRGLLTVFGQRLAKKITDDTARRKNEPKEADKEVKIESESKILAEKPSGESTLSLEREEKTSASLKEKSASQVSSKDSDKVAGAVVHKIPSNIEAKPEKKTASEDPTKRVTILSTNGEENNALSGQTDLDTKCKSETNTNCHQSESRRKRKLSPGVQAQNDCKRKPHYSASTTHSRENSRSNKRHHSEDPGDEKVHHSDSKIQRGRSLERRSNSVDHQIDENPPKESSNHQEPGHIEYKLFPIDMLPSEPKRSLDECLASYKVISEYRHDSSSEKSDRDSRANSRDKKSSGDYRRSNSSDRNRPYSSYPRKNGGRRERNKPYRGNSRDLLSRNHNGRSVKNSGRRWPSDEGSRRSGSSEKFNKDKRNSREDGSRDRTRSKSEEQDERTQRRGSQRDEEANNKRKAPREESLKRKGSDPPKDDLRRKIEKIVASKEDSRERDNGKVPYEKHTSTIRDKVKSPRKHKGGTREPNKLSPKKKSRDSNEKSKVKDKIDDGPKVHSNVVQEKKLEPEDNSHRESIPPINNTVEELEPGEIPDTPEKESPESPSEDLTTETPKIVESEKELERKVSLEDLVKRDEQPRPIEEEPRPMNEPQLAAVETFAATENESDGECNFNSDGAVDSEGTEMQLVLQEENSPAHSPIKPAESNQSGGAKEQHNTSVDELELKVQQIVGIAGDDGGKSPSLSQSPKKNEVEKPLLNLKADKISINSVTATQESISTATSFPLSIVPPESNPLDVKSIAPAKKESKIIKDVKNSRKPPIVIAIRRKRRPVELSDSSMVVTVCESTTNLKGSPLKVKRASIKSPQKAISESNIATRRRKKQ